VFALEHANPGNRDPPALSFEFVAQQWHTDPISLLCSNSSTAKFSLHLKPGPFASPPRAAGICAGRIAVAFHHVLTPPQ
jgi:hypothetical protein